MTRFIKYFLSLGSLAVLALATPAGAQGINPLVGSNLAMPIEDIHMMQDAAKALYAADPPVVGSKNGWKDDATGNFGTVELVEVFEWKGMPCRKMQHVIKITGQRDAVGLTADVCLTPEGEWKTRY
jgi:surface antigen